VDASPTEGWSTVVIISFLLVIIAAVTLIIGLFQDGIEWIWASIASCVLAMVFLGMGVLQRRATPTASTDRSEDDGGPRPREDVGGEPTAPEDNATEDTAAPERTVTDARTGITEAEVRSETATGTAAEAPEGEEER
jgi:hypothetical protein